jgi:hypothetical protein
VLIRIVRKLTPSYIDTLSDRFQPGFQYEVDSAIGRLFIAEGWAVAIGGQDFGSTAPPLEMQHGAGQHSTRQQRESSVPSLKSSIAADIALDEAIARAIERQGRAHGSHVDLARIQS